MATYPTHALYATVSENQYSDGAYLHIKVRAVGLGDDGTPRNLPTEDKYRTDPLAGLTMTAQADRSQHGSAPDPVTYSYAWRLGFATDLDPAPLEVMTAAVATLRRATKGMAALEARYGAPLTFGQYVARVADTLGLRVLTGKAGGDGMYSSGTFVQWAPGESASIIDGWVAAFRA